MSVVSSSGNGSGENSGGKMFPLNRIQVEVQGRDLAELLRHMDTQDHNVAVLMKHWEDLVKWVSEYPRKYLPRVELERKLKEISPL